jgi:hypothetical protein
MKLLVPGVQGGGAAQVGPVQGGVQPLPVHDVHDEPVHAGFVVTTNPVPVPPTPTPL